MPLDPSFIEHLSKNKISVEVLEKAAVAREAGDKRQPKWEKSKSLRYVKDGVTVMAGNTSPQRIVAKFVDEGRVKEARVGYCHYIRMIDPAGNVCSLPDSNNRSLGGVNEKYAGQVLRWKLRDGWLPFDEVPDGRTASRFGLVSRTMEEWRLEREHVIAHLKTQHGVRSAEFGEIYKSQQDKVMQQAAAAAAAPIQTLVESMSKMMGQQNKVPR